MTDRKAKQTPLPDLLDRVPEEIVLGIPGDEPVFPSYTNIPIGKLAQEAAAELRRLDAECNDLAHQLNQSNERNGRLIAQRDAIQQVVDEQAEDEGLWFRAQTAAEAYLQQELRRLHAAVEGEK